MNKSFLKKLALYKIKFLTHNLEFTNLIDFCYELC